MQEFIKVLNTKFNDIPIIKLKDITKKISVISKVRVGKDSSFTDYDEVSLSHLDVYGVLKPSKKGEELGGANLSAIKSQGLNAGDILISYRGKHSFEVGLVGDNYDSVIVGNNSAIRIQFKDDLDDDLPLIIQTYLEEYYVQKYLIDNTYISKNKRQLLSPQTLIELPLPDFNTYKAISFGKFNDRRRDVIHQAKELHKKSRQILNKIACSQEGDLELFVKEDSTLLTPYLKYENLTVFLNEIQDQLNEIDKIFEEDHIKK